MSGFNSTFEKWDIPLLNTKADISNLNLTPKEGFVLSRVDGQTSLERISSISTVPLEEVMTIFKRLADCGAVTFRKVEKSTGAPRPKEKQSILDQLEEDESYENLKNIPRQARRDILLMEEDVGKLNYYDILKVPRNVSKEKLEKVYLKLSKSFHPDRFFGQELGIYKKKLEKIFTKVTDVYETLRSDSKKKKYDRATFPDEFKEEKSKGLDDGRFPKTLIEKLAKAKKFYDMGQTEMRKKNMLTAASYFQMALSYDPKNEDCKKAFEKTKPALNRKKAKALFETAKSKIDLHFYDTALKSLEEALELDPENAEYNYMLAKVLFASKKDYARAKDLCLKAIEKIPDDPEVRIVMGKIYKEVGLTKNAIREFKIALKLDKGNKNARMELDKID